MNTKVTSTVSIGGISFGGTTPLEFDTQLVKSEVLPASTAAALTTRTGNSTGTITLQGGHGLATARYDIYWEGGCQLGLTGTVVANTMTLAAAASHNSGDPLPVAGTPIAIALAQSFAFAAPLAGLQGTFIKSGSAGRSAVVLVDDASSYPFQLPAKGASNWVNDGVTDSPYQGGELVSFFASNGGTSAMTINVAAAWND